MRRTHLLMAIVLLAAGCSKSNNVAVSGGGGSLLVGESCTAKADCGGSECVAGFCRVLCSTDSACEAPSICLSDGTSSGCRLPAEAACSKPGAACDANAALTCGLDKTCRMPCASSCSRDDVACIASACVGKHEADVEDKGWFSCQESSGYAGLFCGGDGNALSACNLDQPGAVVLETCGNAGLCGQAVEQGASACPEAACTPGQFACGGASGGTLQICSTDGTGFVDYDASHDCATPSLCQMLAEQAEASGDVGSCPEPACDAAQGRCLEGTVQRCNQGRTGYSDITTCGPDEQCDPGSQACVTLGIDAAEVTRKDYLEKFLSLAPSTQGQPSPGCDQNGDFTPGSDWPPTPETQSLPVVSVDWCDAYAYCKAVGKRLCGSIAGTGVPKDKFADPAVSQWMNACSSGGQYAYPYGDAPTNACNGQNSWGSNETPTSVDAGSMSGCQSSTPGYAGVLDLSGNVAEWEDSCDSPATGPTDSCRVRGGSFQDVASKMACAADRQVPRSTRSTDIGFRCCAD